MRGDNYPPPPEDGEDIEDLEDWDAIQDEQDEEEMTKSSIVKKWAFENDLPVIDVSLRDLPFKPIAGRLSVAFKEEVEFLSPAFLLESKFICGFTIEGIGPVYIPDSALWGSLWETITLMAETSQSLTSDAFIAILSLRTGETAFHELIHHFDFELSEETVKKLCAIVFANLVPYEVYQQLVGFGRRENCQL